MLRRSLFVVTLLFLSLTARIAFAQAGSADLTGQVLDSTGGLLAGADVTATNVETDVSTKTTSSSGGVYVFTNLPPGSYTVAAGLRASRSCCEPVSRL